MSNIKREDIQVGDTIKATCVLGGVLTQRSGRVFNMTPSIRTDEGCYLWNSGWDGEWVFDLIDRPKPKLPHNPGSVIIASRIENYGSSHVPLFLRHDGYWVTNASGLHFLPEEILEWKLAKIVEVAA